MTKMIFLHILGLGQKTQEPFHHSQFQQKNVKLQIHYNLELML